MKVESRNKAVDMILPVDDKIEFTAVSDDGSDAFKEVEEAKKDEPLYGVVTGSAFVNVRSTPNGEVVSILAEDKKIRIKDEQDGWYYITFDNGMPLGWMNKNYVKLVD